MDLHTHHRQTAAVCVFVVAAHLGALVTFKAALRYRNANEGTTDSSGELIFIAAHPVPSRMALRDEVKVQNTLPRAKAKARDDIDKEEPPLEMPQSMSITDPQAIDWHEQGALANANQLKLAEKAGKQKHFDATDRPPGLPAPKAIERSEIHWDPLHGRRVGLTDEGVFFVKLSDKCMILAVFLVCQFGGKIEPEGKLFERLPDKLDRARERELP